jgi:shikimate kinase
MTPPPTDSLRSSGKMKDRIFLIGFMGSGKSTYGRALARAMRYDFKDMDQLIEETAEMSISAIFEEHGEAVFRKWEHDILLELCKREGVVISTGGGAPCHNGMMQIMKENGITIYIKLPPEALRDRLLRSRTERPLIQGKSPAELLEFIRALLAEREYYYTQASHAVNGIDLQVEELVSLIGHI